MMKKNKIKFNINDVVWFWKVNREIGHLEEWVLICSSIEYFIINKNQIEYFVKSIKLPFTNGCYADDVLYPSFEYAVANDPKNY